MKTGAKKNGGTDAKVYNTHKVTVLELLLYGHQFIVV